MADVLKFPAKEEQEPHLSGIARCLDCKHEHVAVAPVGVTVMECPKCGTMRSVWCGPAYPPKDGKIFVCGACDATAFCFTLKEDGTHIQCLGCGVEPSIDSVFPPVRS